MPAWIRGRYWRRNPFRCSTGTTKRHCMNASKSSNGGCWWTWWPRWRPPAGPGLDERRPWDEHRMSTDESRRAIRRALISVYDKTGLIELAEGLSAAGVEI